MKKNKNIFYTVLGIVGAGVIAYFIFKRLGKKGSKIKNAERYAQFGDEPLVVAKQLEPLAYGNYKWSGGTGMPVDIYFKSDKPLFTKTPDGSTYCTGFTFATFYITALNRGLLNNLTDNDIINLKNVWNQGEATNRPKLCVDAIANTKNSNGKTLGKEVSFENAKAGDFCQIWRKGGSGHSVIFKEPLIENGKKVGIVYYSSNASKNPNTGRSGAGEGKEKFTNFGGGVLKDNTYFARLKN